MNLTSSKQYIQLEATRFQSPVSENMIQAIGGSINFLLDFIGNVVEYTTPGSHSYVVATTAKYLIIAHGGGGGGGGGKGGGGGSGAGGGGGAYSTCKVITVTPGTYTITIGSGGAGGAGGVDGSAGGDTSFGVLAVFKGGEGGKKGLAEQAADIFNLGSPGGRGRTPDGGYGGPAFFTNSEAYNGEAGRNSPFASGGAAGTSAGLNGGALEAYGSGGGGGGGDGAGGAGGAGSAFGSGSAGGSGTNGGGGGGGGSGATGGGAGGTGGDGYFAIIAVNAP